MQTMRTTQQQRNLPFQIISLLIAVLQVSLAFVPSSRPYRSAPLSNVAVLEGRRGLTLARHERPTTLLRVVADAEKEELHKNKRNDSDNDDGDSNSSSSWIPTASGGFLPNFSSRSPVTTVSTLEDYKSAVVDEPNRLVVVRFYAPWCRACKAVASGFRKLALDHSDVKFVEVPLTKTNAFLHQGLGVPSLPFAHIYHPEAGLVEERSINKKIFGDFKHVLQTYIDGECQIDWEDFE